MTAKKQTLKVEETQHQELYKCQLYTADIKRKIKEVARAIKSNEQSLQFMNLSLTLHDGLLTMTGGNKTLFLECDVPLLGASTSNTLSVLVDKKYFVNAVNNFEHDFMTITVKEFMGDAADLYIEHGSDSILLRACDAKEYSKTLQEIKAQEYSKAFEIGAADLVSIQKEVAIAASVKDFRPQLTGVNLSSLEMLQAKNKQKQTSKPYLVAAATDSYRLSKMELKDIEAKGLDITLPSDVFKFNKLFDKDAKIQVKTSKDHAILEAGGARMIASLYSEVYPNISKLFPESFDIKATFNTQALMSVMKSVSDLGNNQVAPCDFVMGDGTIKAGTFAKEGVKFEKVLPTLSYEGEPLKISFNANYMIDSIKAFGDVQTITLEFISRLKPIRVTCNERPELVGLVVPLRRA